MIEPAGSLGLPAGVFGGTGADTGADADADAGSRSAAGLRLGIADSPVSDIALRPPLSLAYGSIAPSGPHASMTKRRYHLQWPFWLYCGLTLLVGFAATNTGHNLLFWVFGAMASALLISGLVSGLMMIRLSVRRVIPGQGVVGEPLVVRYAVTNGTRFFPVFNIFCEEIADAEWTGLLRGERAWIMHIGPRERNHGDALYATRRRGVAGFQAVRIWTTFPFGIVKKSITFAQPQHTLIHPRVFPLRERVLDAVTPAGALGTHVSSHAGAGDEYYGLREFRAGDSLRHVSWKRTASRDELVCIERAQPSPPRLRVVLDLTGLGERGDATLESRRQREESAICLAASFIHAADRRGLEIGLDVLGVDEPPIPVQRTHWHRNRLMAALARIDLACERERDERPQPVARGHASVVVIHPDRPVLGIGTAAAWHFSAEQMDHLIDPDAEPVAPPVVEERAA